jgi:hypothetical protein
LEKTAHLRFGTEGRQLPAINETSQRLDDGLHALLDFFAYKDSRSCENRVGGFSF